MRKLYLVRTLVLAGSLLLQLSTLCFHSRGAAGDVDLSFDPGSGVNGYVNTVVVQPDGKVIIGGLFTTVKGLLRTNLARLNADGSGDATFNPVRAYNPVYALAVQPDGKVLVGGQFLEPECGDWGCYYPTAVIRLNADGSLDSSFNPATANDYGEYRCLVVQSDGKVLIGGLFYNVNGTNRNGIARLNTNGSLDSTFDPGTGATGGSYAVNSVDIQSDGKVLIGGEFTTVNGTNRNRIARLNANGSLDSAFNPGTGVSGWIYSVALQPDGKVLLGGDFLSVNGTNHIGIARLNSNGSLDSSFDSGAAVAGGYYQEVFSLAMQSDGKVLIAGSFTTMNGTNSIHGIVRLNANGSLDGSFNPGTGVGVVGGGYYVVSSVVVQSDGKVLVGGDFTGVNGTIRNRMARLDANGSLDGSFNPGAAIESSVFSLAVQPDGKVLVGGYGLIARLNTDGSLDSTFTPATRAFSVSSVALQSDGKVLIAGDFFIGTNYYSFARVNADGSLDNSFEPPNLVIPGHPFNHIEAAHLAVQSDGKILIAGANVTYECDTFGEYCDYYYSPFVARLNPNGIRDTNFNPNIAVNGFVNSIAIQSDGKVLLGGGFSIVDGTNRSGIARLNADGSLDSSFNPANIYFDYGEYRSLVVQSDGKVLIGGLFYNVNGTNRNGIARLNANGSLDSSFNPGAGAYGVSSVALQSDGKVLIGGYFTTVNGTNRNHIARLNANGSLDSSFNPGTGADGSVRSIALQSDGNVLIGGDFTTVNGVVRPRVARLYGDSFPPSLNIARSNALVIVSWPVTGLNFQLQETSDLSLPNSWSPVAQPAVTNAGQLSMTVPTTVGRKFFRLKSQ